MRRNFLYTILVQIIGAFIITLVVSTLIFSIVMDSLRQGIIIGLIFGGGVAVIAIVGSFINIKPAKVSIGFKSKNDFLAKFNKAVDSINYKLKTKDENVYI